MGVVGAAIKGFGKALKGHKTVINRTTGKPFPKSIQQHMKAADKRRATMKKAGYKKEPYAIASSKTKGEDTTHKLKEMWSYNPYKKAKPSEAKKIAKRVAPIAAAMVGSSAAGYYGGKKSKKK